MNQSGITPEIQRLVQRILEHETAGEDPSERDTAATLNVCRKLGVPIRTLAGAAGFQSLLGRALTLSKRDAPSLAGAQLRDDDTVDGVVGDPANANRLLIGHLLELLTTFLGETFTLHLVRSAWPDLPGAETELRDQPK